MAGLLTDMAAGAAAGIVGGMALGGTAQVLYDLASPKDVAREKAIEPRNPFIVLAQQLEGAAGMVKRRAARKAVRAGGDNRSQRFDRRFIRFSGAQMVARLARGRRGFRRALLGD